MRKRSNHFVLKKHQTSFFEAKYIFCLFFILILCLVDGTFTIILLQKGAWEANPVMRYALSVSYEFFFFLKYFLTAGGLLFLFSHGDRKVFGGLLTPQEIAGGLVLFYEGLVIYEIAIYHYVK
jgi:hypothetical protein